MGETEAFPPTSWVKYCHLENNLSMLGVRQTARPPMCECVTEGERDTGNRWDTGNNVYTRGESAGKAEDESPGNSLMLWSLHFTITLIHSYI